eukprot:GHRR01021759.1.p1 GENE.GHRR01021759.1~~GHRR01021759.1.p1  ORF type:complete len:133 (-),score=39.56 GHRR01021759.1:386-784(-)
MAEQTALAGSVYSLCILARSPVLFYHLQAQVLQQANLMAGKRSAPLWALGAILFLGWNEFMVVLWNPLYLLLGAVLFFFGWQMYSELDVDAELQRGPVMGLVNIYNKLGGVLRTVGLCRWLLLAPLYFLECC